MNLPAFTRLAAALAALTLLTQPAFAQRGPRCVPTEAYFTAFVPYYDGDYKIAMRVFRDAARSGVVSTEGRWIDSICYHTMLGECYYQMGDLVNALDQHNSALKMYLMHRDWLNRVDFPQQLSAQVSSSTSITWGKTSRTTTLGQYQDRYQSLQGRADNEQVIQKGGVVSPQQLYPVYVVEIIRCTSQSIARRREIMGPACEHDPLTLEVADALSRRPGPVNHWAQCWVELELGLALAAANKMPQATSELQRSLLAAGQYEHPLTCLGLLELGKIALEQGKYDTAITFLHEATISAAFFDRFDVMEEGFRLGALAHVVSGQKGVYSPLEPAAAWSRKLPMLQVSILTALADSCLAAGDVPGANVAVGAAQKSLGRSDMGLGQVGARLNFQAARVALQSGNGKGGASSLAAALTFEKAASKRLFQIKLVDEIYKQSGVTERVADLLYADVLREPTRIDWTVDPLGTMTVGMVPHQLPYEHWFELSLIRKEQDQALNVADRIRRHRFYALQPLGGRILALRWVLEAPAEALTKDAQLQRQELLIKYPKYAELSRQAKAASDELAKLPIAPADEADQKKQAAVLENLAAISSGQEVWLQVMALERVPSDFAFPPLRDTKELQAQVPAGSLVLVYLATSRGLHGFALTKDQYVHFPIAQPGKVKADVAALLKGLGHLDRTQPIDVASLVADDWKHPAASLLAQLANDTKPADWAKYNQVVIVPDGPLWYLPFEALLVPGDGDPQPLLSQAQVRYAPTLSLALPDARPIPRDTRTAIVAGKLYPREDDALTQAAAEQMAALENATILQSNPAAPVLAFSSTMDRLVLMADVEEPERLPFGWSPLKLDAGKPGSTLADLMALPWAGPQQVVFPGFHTPAEYALKRGGTGEEVFLTVCGLMASGCRTVLLSRWRVGGQSTVELMREFVQELPHEPAAAAWQRSVQLANDRVIDPGAEPRLRPGQAADGLKGSHPFFWAGYMLVDTGAGPAREMPAKAAVEKAEKAAEKDE